ncbi:MAG TPA: DEAD/DEAH box helicase [Anaerolineaceae bacterium]|nr:DEAD/DEAH box helicase [Anaerolineaceae bacterium]
MVCVFDDLGLQPEYLEAVERLGYTQPTPIQVETIPALLQGRDVVAQSQTGTGKTAAFMLPILQRLEPGMGSVQALVLAPTRELAKQVADATEGFARETRVRVLAVYGGQSYEVQFKALKRGVDIVVGTPGRLLDLIHQGKLDLSHVRTLVLDEADEMLEMGFIEDVELILNEMPDEKQIALFSATLPEPIRKLASKYLDHPEKISVSPNQLTVAETEQMFCRVREETKLAALAALLETEEVSSALIFARTKARAQDLADELLRRGFSADSLHGDLNQSRRELVLNRFRKGTVTLLVATDVAARGLDISDVSHVFNYDMPADAEDYVHRIGRTGRAGKKGVAITLLEDALGEHLETRARRLAGLVVGTRHADDSPR